MSPDILALIYSFLYVGAVVIVGETASRLGLSREFARKIIHVGVGLWVFPTLALFDSRWLAAVPAITAAVGNYVIHRRQLLKSVEAEQDNLGTLWFPVSFALLILLAWDRPAAVAGGVAAMTFGDAAASLVGVRWGSRTYESVGGARKSLEGSLTMFGATFLALSVTLGAYGVTEPHHPYAFGYRTVIDLTLALAALCAVAATCLEALGAKGRDNLWVPLGVGALIWASHDPVNSWTVPVGDAFARPLSGYEAMRPETVVALGIGAVCAAIIGVYAWRRSSLSPSGVLGAILTGTLVFGLAGWTGGLALVGFFVSSSLLSRLFRTRKAEVEADYAKTGTRDLGQALANGGVAAAAALLYGITRQPPYLGGFEELGYLGALLGALAAANADTWATELGVLSRSRPRLITTFRPVAPGTSGAISLVGTLAALGGAAFIGLVGALADGRWWPALPVIALAGLAGALLDSLLGATLQGVYWCNTCQKETERTFHRCGAATRPHRGLAWLGNDTVNLLATLLGAVVGYFAI